MKVSLPGSKIWLAFALTFAIGCTVENKNGGETKNARITQIVPRLVSQNPAASLPLVDLAETITEGAPNAGLRSDQVIPLADIHVAVDGSDDASGALVSPFRTIGRAKKEAGLRARRLGKPITVYIHPGNYLITSPVQFSSEDSGLPTAPITFRNYSDMPVLSAAVTFKNGVDGTWSETMVNTVSGVRQGIKVFRFTKAETVAILRNFIAQSRAEKKNLGAFAFSQAFVNGERAIRSRHPNLDVSVDLHYLRDVTVCPKSGVPAAQRQGYVLVPNSVTRQAAISDGKTEIVFNHLYQDVRALVAGTNVASAQYDGVATSMGSRMSEFLGACWEDADAKGHFENNLAVRSGG